MLSFARQASDLRVDQPGLPRAFRSRLLRACLSLWMLAAACPPAFSASLQVLIVTSGDSAPYAETAQHLASGIERNGLGRARTIGADALARADPSGADLVVALGVKATQAAAARNERIPVISTLIPRVSFEKIVRQYDNRRGGRHFSAAYLDQPMDRQLDLIRLVLPDKKRVGVVIGPESEDMLARLQTEVRAQGMELHAVRIGSEAELIPALEDLFGKTDVLLSLPDPLVFNAQTIPGLLLTSYHAGVPVIGFSPAYVRAGALAAVHSTPAQLARQVLEMLAPFAAGRGLPPPQYPRYFSVGANRHVAHSLGLKIDAEERLALRLQAGGAGP